MSTHSGFEPEGVPPGDGRLRVLVVAAYPAARAGLHALLEADESIAVVAEAAPASTAAGDAPSADVVVADTAGDEELLVSVLQESFPGTPLVVVGATAEDVVTDLRAFATPRAYLTREATAEELAAAVHAVAQGLAVFSPVLISAAELSTPARRGHGPDALTERELEVLPLLAAGLPNKAIALRLGISEHTVKFHVGAILSKLGAASRTEAVVIAARRGFLPL